MSAITEPDQKTLERTRQAQHPFCVVCGRADACGRSDEVGLGLRFALDGEGGVAARFDCAERFQGYTGLLHGGVTASLLDGAMTNCLFAHGIAAVTGEMTVRFRHPVKLGGPLVVRARITRSQKPLHVVEAEITQGGQLKARSVGKFMEPRPGPAGPGC